MTLSSTTLNLYADNCPAALGFYEAGEPMERSIFQPGIAAHAVLQVVGEKGATDDQQATVADAVVEELLTNGRTFRGHHEPPMPPDAALAGRDLALNWLLYNELPTPAQHELGLAMDAAGEACRDDDPAAIFEGIIDTCYHELAEDEEFSAATVVVRDYKSAWPHGEEQLHTLQRKAQAVLSWLHYPKAEAITREVVNIRTFGLYRETTWLDDEGIATLERWRDDILLLCRTAGQNREARAGLNCIGCPYVLRCETANDMLSCAFGGTDIELYGACKSTMDALAPRLRLATKEGPLKDGHGFLVGYKPGIKKEPNAEAIETITGLWYVDGCTDNGRGLLKAMGVGVSGIENAVKVLMPGKENKLAREDLLSDCLDKKTDSKFKAWKDNADGSAP